MVDLLEGFQAIWAGVVISAAIGGAEDLACASAPFRDGGFLRCGKRRIGLHGDDASAGDAVAPAGEWDQLGGVRIFSCFGICI